MKAETKNTTTETRRNVWELDTIAEEMQLCRTVCNIDLSAMLRSTGHQEALADLIRGSYTDRLWSNSAERNTRATALHATADQHRETADTARKVLKRIRITDEERTQAQEVLDHYTTLADNDRAEASDTEKRNATLTASNYQDMLHTVWIELQAIKADPERQTPDAFGALCKAGREYIYQLTAVSTLDKLNTISKPLSVSEAVYLMKRYDINPSARPRQKWTQTAKGCTGYYTLEPKERKRDTDPRKVDPAIIANYAHYNEACLWYYENITLPSTHSTHAPAFPALDAKAHALNYWHRLTKAQKLACLGLDPSDNPILYCVLHVPTIRTQYSTDSLTDKDPRTAEAVTAGVLAGVNIPELVTLAKLGQQARTAVEALTHPEAVTLAKTAYNEAIATGEQSIEKLQSDRAEAGKKPYSPGKVNQMRKQYQQTASNAYTDALWGYALSVAGYTATAQAMAKHRIIDKLVTAYRKAPDSLTPGQIDYSHLMRSSYRGHAEAHTAPIDTLKWTASTSPNHKPIVKWQTPYNRPGCVNVAISAFPRYIPIGAEANQPSQEAIEYRQTLPENIRFTFDSFPIAERNRIAKAVNVQKAIEAEAKARAEAEAQEAEEAKKRAENAARAKADKEAREAYEKSPAGIMRTAEVLKADADREQAEADKQKRIAQFYSDTITEAYTTHRERLEKPGYIEMLIAKRTTASDSATAHQIKADQVRARAEATEAKAKAHPDYQTYLQQLRRIAEAVAKSKKRKK